MKKNSHEKKWAHTEIRPPGKEVGSYGDSPSQGKVGSYGDSPSLKPATLLAFGAHPDDIEFGCGGIIARETSLGRPAHFVVCSRGESGTHGTPKIRTAESRRGAMLLGATVEFLELDGDAHLEIRTKHLIQLASIIRRIRPSIILAPTLVQNQHPDHWRLAQMVRDASRLARYGGFKELRKQAPHVIEHLFFYAVSVDSEPAGQLPLLIDVTEPKVVAAWTESMEAHASQMTARNYVDLQLTRARTNGLRAGVEFAISLFPNDPVVLDSLEGLSHGARRF